MTANTSPVFTFPKSGRARVTGANTASDGSGSNLGVLFRSGANGSILDRIRYNNSQATAALSSAMVLRFFVTDTVQADPRLLAEVALSAATRSTTVVGAAGVYEFPGGYPMESGQEIWVGQSIYAGVQDQMDYIGEYGDF
jgi:hypothetical protein